MSFTPYVNLMIYFLCNLIYLFVCKVFNNKKSNCFTIIVYTKDYVYKAQKTYKMSWGYEN